jgi:hypothetical protein
MLLVAIGACACILLTLAWREYCRLSNLLLNAKMNETFTMQGQVNLLHLRQQEMLQKQQDHYQRLIRGMHKVEQCSSPRVGVPDNFEYMPFELKKGILEQNPLFRDLSIHKRRRSMPVNQHTSVPVVSEASPRMRSTVPAPVVREASPSTRKPAPPPVITVEKFTRTSSSETDTEVAPKPRTPPAPIKKLVKVRSMPALDALRIFTDANTSVNPVKPDLHHRVRVNDIHNTQSDFWSLGI